MKLGIIGSRSRNTLNDKKLLMEKIKELNPSILISGGCKKGADKFAEELSVETNIPITVFLPNIEKNMKYFETVKEYYKRNKKIANESDIILACVSSNRKGGTENTIKYAKKLGKKIIMI